MSKTRTEYLQDILASIHKHYDSNNLPHLPTSQTWKPAPVIQIPSLSFERPASELRLKLQQSKVSSAISIAALESASQIARHYQESYTKYCTQVLSGPLSAEYDEDTFARLQRTYEHLFEHKDVVHIFSKASESQALITANLQGHRRPPPALERRPFNHKFTPFLEAYFEQNAYPSPADQQTLSEKGNMDRAKIVNWFQNHRNRLRSAGKGSDLKRLLPGQAVDLELIEAKTRSSQEDASSDDGVEDDEASISHINFKLDDLVRSSVETISKTHGAKSAESCAATSEAFGLPAPISMSTTRRSSSPTHNLDEMLSQINIAAGESSKAGAKTNVVKGKGSRASTPKASTRPHSFKASLRSCFSAAITLTCPRSHPALIRQKKKHALTSSSASRSTVLEHKHVPVQPYTLPAVLPTWELHAPSVPEPVVRRKKPTLASHAGKTRPGSPYPKQTLSRVSSSSSLASMASNDSQSSSRSVSSTSSTSTLESLELETPAQSPSTNHIELIDDARFSDDIFGDYLFNPDPFPMDFSTFDLNVEEPFDKDVSLSFAEFDQPISLSIADFDSTTVPSFDFFES